MQKYKERVRIDNSYIKSKRIERGFTQAQIAKQIKISVRYYQDIEAQKSIPNVNTAMLLAQALQEPIEEIFPIKK